MKWLDSAIDALRRSTLRLSPSHLQWMLDAFGPYSRVGSIVNAVICGGLAVFATVLLAVSGQPEAIIFLVLGSVLWLVFVRIAVRANRGDFDDDHFDHYVV